MKDVKEVVIYCVEKYFDVKFYVLVLNLYGVKVVWECGIRDIFYVIFLSEIYNKKNINCIYEEFIDEFKKIMNIYLDMNICIGMVIVFGCFFEGLLKIEDVIRFVKCFWENGIREINLVDIIGIVDFK